MDTLHQYGRPPHWRRVRQFDDGRWLHDQRLPKAALRFGRLIMLGPFQLEIRHLALDHPWVRAYIPEGDLGKVKLGQKVKLTTDSFPGKAYWGRVTFISSEAEFTPKQIQTNEERVKLVYRIKVEVDNSNHELKSNMPVDAVIDL